MKLFTLNFITKCDTLFCSEPAQFGFQNPGSSIMQGIINLHHHIFFIIIIVFIFVSYVMWRTYVISTITEKKSLLQILDTYTDGRLNYRSNIKFILFRWLNIAKFATLNVNHGTTLEIIWTIIPSLLLLCIVGPSFSLLFAMDAISDPDYSIKIVGHQWYWSYEYSDAVNYTAWTPTYHVIKEFIPELNSQCQLINNIISSISFDSYMVPTVDLNEGELRLLEVYKPLVVPIYTNIRLDITSDDVMHAFAIPALGIKLDAIPGRLNVIYLDILMEGIFFGQCSELCGVNHGFMPIKLEAVNLEEFNSYLLSEKTLVQSLPEFFFLKLFDETNSSSKNSNIEKNIFSCLLNLKTYQKLITITVNN